MEKLYIDRTKETGAFSVWVKDAEVINAGTTMHPMPLRHKNDRYEEIARRYDIHFIFEDNVPEITYYAVPMLDIFAVDNKGGQFATLGQGTMFEVKAPICYIDASENCYEIAADGNEFMEKLDTWKECMMKRNDVIFYKNREEAKKVLTFIEFGVGSCGCHNV